MTTNRRPTVFTRDPDELIEEIRSLRAELKIAHNEIHELYKRYARLADSERVIDWIRNGTKPAVLSFTSGPERSICYVVESLWKSFDEDHLSVLSPVEAFKERQHFLKQPDK